LYNKALEIARQKKADYIWSGVWEENQEQLIFIRKTPFWHLTSIFSKWGMTNKQLS